MDFSQHSRVDRVLELLDIEQILIDVYDRRLSPIDKLQMNQLRDECATRSLPTDGRKVSASMVFYYCSNITGRNTFNTHLFFF